MRKGGSSPCLNSFISFCATNCMGIIMDEFYNMESGDVRKLIREEIINGPTAGMCAGYVQANLVILPKAYADDFKAFAIKNPKPCPVLEVLDEGNIYTKVIAKNSNIASDIPRYRIYKKGQLVEECLNIEKYWQNDFVSFLIGCSFTFESALINAGIEIRHITMDRNVPMYKTNIMCKEVGAFKGPMVVSMRPIPEQDVEEAIRITKQFPRVHGEPVHIGNPNEIGIKDLYNPDYGDSVEIKKGEVPVFWACGVTPQAVCEQAKPDIMITHVPGHMFIADIKNEQLINY